MRSDSSDHIFNRSDLIGKEGGQQLLLGVSQLFDNRDNVSYSTRGYYAKLRLAYAPKLWTSTDFNGANLDLDLRGFIPLHKKVTLALQGIFRSTFGKTIPFYNYRELGGDMMMRGYYLGRYRDKTTSLRKLNYAIAFILVLALSVFRELDQPFQKKIAAGMYPVMVADCATSSV
ncbi:outer membrane protein assembly factor [Sphingobacterium sp. E70]|uniref:outer membrane protein assembly factor n=1 Tax=Sphingobacterium sp. E70 TaxID=2853439 RepID=UPI00211C75EC|nr:outer membrane protein assembly factor [Sphingobacterium sp. E70]ULT28865.1 outer membrane protein assembly factor [Sphingobacterium sp. E70]